MIRVVYSVNPKNQEAMFSMPMSVTGPYADAAMQICEANALMLARGQSINGMEPVKDPEPLALSTDLIMQNYPLFSSSFFNLVQTAEARIGFKERRR